MARRKQEAATDRDDRRKAIAAVAAKFAGFKPATEVLTRVRAVPTIFPQYDVATRVAGHPIERITLIHGPSNEGKTKFALGLILSFLLRDHFAGLVDAEYTTPETWLRELMAEQAAHPGFVAMRPETYEQTRDSVKSFCETIGEARETGLIDPETSAICVVDSLRKLVPAKIFEKLGKDAEANGLDGMGGRAAQYKAALNAQWMDELVPLLYHTKTSLVLIAREREKPNASPWETPYEVGGGKAPLYESSIAARITRSWVKEGDKQVGERHRVQIYKTKVGGREGKFTDSYFHTLLDAGFDRARDVLEMAIECGAIEKDKGHAYHHEGEVLGRGESAALAYLRSHPEVLESAERAARSSFNPAEGDLAHAGEAT